MTHDDEVGFRECQFNTSRTGGGWDSGQRQREKEISFSLLPNISNSWPIVSFMVLCIYTPEASVTSASFCIGVAVLLCVPNCN